jgi:uncharacterized protein with HEPN domain
MPSRDTDRVLKAIAYNIDLARRFTGGLSLEAFIDDERTVYAVTRCLEIVSEASRRLPDSLKKRHPNVPWERVAGAGNVYRHDYEDVLPTILWTTIREHLSELEHAVQAELSDSKEK